MPTEYGYNGADAGHAHDYLAPAVITLLEKYSPSKRLLELGCGNGSFADRLSSLGYDVTGVDPSESGVRIARENFAGRFEVGSTDEDLAARFGRFDCVLSLEVVEHVFLPRRFASCVRSLLNPNGIAIVSTPYHGYIKNLALAFSNRWDAHLTALWDYGHIKFWSRRTLGQLFAEVGLTEIDFRRVGRVPALAKSMVCAYRKANSA